ncbi:MAG: hypothetical protein ACKVP5_07495, partial [Aestuariivirga sp.]
MNESVLIVEGLAVADAMCSIGDVRQASRAGAGAAAAVGFARGEGLEGVLGVAAPAWGSSRAQDSEAGHAHEVVGERVPEDDGAGLGEAAHGELDEAAAAELGVGA